MRIRKILCDRLDSVWSEHLKLDTLGLEVLAGADYHTMRGEKQSCYEEGTREASA